MDMYRTIGIAITMYDEQSTVLKSLRNICSALENKKLHIVVVHSEDSNPSEELEEIKEIAKKHGKYILLPNLHGTVDNMELPAHAIVRNYSTAFEALASLSKEYDFVVGMTGDTLITDAHNFERRRLDLVDRSQLVMVARAIGQNFHAQDDHGNLVTEGRYQRANTTDFMPQLFMLKGSFFNRKGPFVHMEVTNKFTSEQCLGDELIRFTTNKHIAVLNPNQQHAYSYTDGVQYHAK